MGRPALVFSTRAFSLPFAKDSSKKPENNSDELFSAPPPLTTLSFSISLSDSLAVRFSYIERVRLHAGRLRKKNALPAVATLAKRGRVSTLEQRAVVTGTRRTPCVRCLAERMNVKQRYLYRVTYICSNKLSTWQTVAHRWYIRTRTCVLRSWNQLALSCVSRTYGIPSFRRELFGLYVKPYDVPRAKESNLSDVRLYRYTVRNLTHLPKLFLSLASHLSLSLPARACPCFGCRAKYSGWTSTHFHIPLFGKYI